MAVKFWGVRGSIATPESTHAGVGGNTTCVEIQLPSRETLIIDAGTGMRSLGTKLMEEAAGKDLNLHVLLTHFHWDHVQGIPFFRPLYSEQIAITFYAMTPAAQTEELLRGQMRAPYFSIDFDSLPSTRCFESIAGRDLFIGETRITSFPLHHPQGCRGYRLQNGDSSIVFASDFEHGDPKYDRILADAAKGADVLILDAQYTPEEYETHRGWGHSTWMEATRIAKDAGAKRLILFHHDPGHDDRMMEGILAEAREHFRATTLAREGEQFTLA